MSNMAVNRLNREFKKLETKPVDNIIALPDPKNIFEWHFVIYDLQDSQYTGGYYHGKIIFPPEYPHKPPKIIFITPSGRFKTNEPICLSFTNFHPESWNPSWTIETMLIGLISFMNSNDVTAGSIRTGSSERKSLADKSLFFNLDNPEFDRIFKSRYEQLDITEDKVSEGKEYALSAKNKGNSGSDHNPVSEEEARKSIFLLVSIVVVFAGYAIFKAYTGR